MLLMLQLISSGEPVKKAGAPGFYKKTQRLFFMIHHTVFYFIFFSDANHNAKPGYSVSHGDKQEILHQPMQLLFLNRKSLHFSLCTLFCSGFLFAFFQVLPMV